MIIEKISNLNDLYNIYRGEPYYVAISTEKIKNKESLVKSLEFIIHDNCFMISFWGEGKDYWHDVTDWEYIDKQVDGSVKNLELLTITSQNENDAVEFVTKLVKTNIKRIYVVT